MESQNMKNFEDFPEINLDREDKIRIIKGLILFLLFSSLFVSSIIFYNAPNHNPNLIFENKHNPRNLNNNLLHENPVYRLTSRLISKNYIELEIARERLGKNNPIASETLKDLKILIVFAKERAKIEIFSMSENPWKVPKQLFDKNDFEMEKEGRIEDINESDIGIHIINHPFSFYLYRKDTKERLFDTTISEGSKNFDHYLYFAKNYIQISSRLPKGHFTYGLGERFSSLRLKNGKYVLWAQDPLINLNNEPLSELSTENFYSSIPYILTVNPEGFNAWGSVILNSSPMEANLEKDYINYKLTSGILEMYVFSGPRPKDVILQLHQTFGTPLLQSFSNLNWHGNILTNDPLKHLTYLNSTIFSDIKKTDDIDSNLFKSTEIFFDSEKKIKLPIRNLWIDFTFEQNNLPINKVTELCDILEKKGLSIYRYKRSPLLIDSEKYKIANDKSLCIKQSNNKSKNFVAKTPYGDSCIIDYMNMDVLEFIKKEINVSKEKGFKKNMINLLMNEPSHLCSGDCSLKNNINETKLPFIPGDKGNHLEKNTLPLNCIQNNDENLNFLNTHNIYSLEEAKTYHTAIYDSGIKRPIVISRSIFPGAQQYTGKWLGYIEPSWLGLKISLIQSMLSNIQGNPNVIFEACGYNKFSVNTSNKINNLNTELCLRWIQLASLQSFARMNNFEIIPNLQEDDLINFKSAMDLRLKLSVYINTYLINIAKGGGTLFRPLFLDFKSEKCKESLFELESQFMLGSNIMGSPVLNPGERMKRTYFPDERFYDFYDGTLINPKGEGYISLEANLDKMLLFVRGGYITPIQQVENECSSVEAMRIKPIELLIALDQNLRAIGRVFFDDGFSEKSIRNKEFYRMDITVILNQDKDLEVIFHSFKSPYVKNSAEYPHFNKLKIYGIYKKVLRIKKSQYITNTKTGEKENKITNLNSFVIDEDSNALIIGNLTLPIEDQIDYKIIIEMKDN